jgi:hypothetical protein
MIEPRDRRAEDRDETAARAAARDVLRRALFLAFQRRTVGEALEEILADPLDRTLDVYRSELATNALRRQVMGR